MIYIFNGDEVEEHDKLPLNPACPLGTWACIRDVQGGVQWYQCSKGTLETFWSYFGKEPAILPNKLRLKLLILGAPK